MSTSTAASASPPPSTSSRLSYLDALRGAAIVFIVWTHAAAYARHEPHSALAVWLTRLTPGLPFFFLVDGFLFARSVLRRSGRLDYGTYAWKSAWRLLVPWAVFTLLYVLCRGGVELLDLRRGGTPLFQTRLVVGQSPGAILRHALDSSIAMQMYFLPTLFVIRLMSFATRWLVRAGAG